MPPDGNGRKEDWHNRWGHNGNMYLTPSQCSVIGQSLVIACYNPSCAGGGFTCRKIEECPKDAVEIDGKCFIEDDKCDPNSPNLGNPCDPATGNKLQVETDYVSNSGLSIIRTYNSQGKVNRSIGRGWTHRFEKKLFIGSDTIGVQNSSGKSEAWTKVGGAWVGPNDTEISLVETANEFILERSDGRVENYNHDGALVSEVTSSGMTTTYTYSGSNRLEVVTNHFGNALTFTWENGRITTISNPYGEVYTYDYYEGNLISVTYPDATVRQYHYEDARFPHHLTGITDENGNRYATFAYDAEGRAVSTTHADIGNGPQEQFQIDYTQDD